MGCFHRSMAASGGSVWLASRYLHASVESAGTSGTHQDHREHRNIVNLPGTSLYRAISRGGTVRWLHRLAPNGHLEGPQNGRHSSGRPTGRLAVTAQVCNPRTLCCEAFELLRLRPGPVQPSLGPQSAKPALSLQWAHQSNLGRTSAQHHPDLAPGGANPSCTTAAPPEGWGNRAAPTRSGREQRRGFSQAPRRQQLAVPPPWRNG